jgi:hypothetical protein
MGPTGAPGPAWSTHYAEQDSGVEATGQGTWVDIPGAALMFTADTDSTVDLQAAAVFISSAVGSPDEFVRCAVRFVMDLEEFGDPVAGQLNAFVGVQTFNTTMNGSTLVPFTLMHRTTVAPGLHTLRVQLSRLPGDKLPATQGCGVNTPVRVRATVMPDTAK